MHSDPSVKHIYQWTTRRDAIAEDAIMVGIGGASSDMIAAGFTYSEPEAEVYWCSRVTPFGFFEAGGVLGDTPLEALARAAELCQEMGYARVVVIIQQVGLWREEWGRLADREGFNW